MPVSGKLEVTIKISEYPSEVATVQNGWKEFKVECEGKQVSITVRPKVFNKLEEAKAKYPEWVAAITGKLGALTEKGFVLQEPSIQVFERKPKEAQPAAPKLPSSEPSQP